MTKIVKFGKVGLPAFTNKILNDLGCNNGKNYVYLYQKLGKLFIQADKIMNKQRYAVSMDDALVCLQNLIQDYSIDLDKKHYFETDYDD